MEFVVSSCLGTKTTSLVFCPVVTILVVNVGLGKLSSCPFCRSLFSSVNAFDGSKFCVDLLEVNYHIAESVERLSSPSSLLFNKTKVPPQQSLPGWFCLFFELFLFLLLLSLSLFISSPSLTSFLFKISFSSDEQCCNFEECHQKTTMYCPKCEEFICNQCDLLIGHSTSLTTRKHQREEKKAEGAQTGKKCNEHNMPATAYCLFCSQFVCPMCDLSSSHQSHRESGVKSFRESAAKRREELAGVGIEVESILIQLNMEKERSEADMKSLESQKREFEEKIKEIETKIKDKKVDKKNFELDLEDIQLRKDALYRLFMMSVPPPRNMKGKEKEGGSEEEDRWTAYLDQELLDDSVYSIMLATAKVLSSFSSNSPSKSPSHPLTSFSSQSPSRPPISSFPTPSLAYPLPAISQNSPFPPPLSSPSSTSISVSSSSSISPARPRFENGMQWDDIPSFCPPFTSSNLSFEKILSPSRPSPSSSALKFANQRQT